MGRNTGLKNIARAGLFLATALSGIANAEAQSYYPSNNSSVVVDQSVLEDLGPAPSLASLLMPESQSFVPPRVTTQPLVPATAATKPVVPKKAVAPGVRKQKAQPLPGDSKPKKAATPKPAKPAKAEPVVANVAPAKPVEMPKIVPTPTPAAAKVEPSAPKVVAPPLPTVKEGEDGAPRRIAPTVKEDVPAAPDVKVAAVQASPLPPPAAKLDTDQGVVRISFTPDGQKIPDSASQGLRQVADAMKQDTGLRAKITAGASGTDPSKSRKLSLTRAHEVRKILADMGIQSTRVDMSALGNTIGGDNLDRVDLQIVRR